MARVTYYLGAGASFYSMPLLNGIEERLKIYEDYIFHLCKNEPSSTQVENYLKELKNLILNIKQSTSIDNYANELFNNNNIPELNKLKHITSGFFVFEQLKKENPLLTQETEPAFGLSSVYKSYPKEIDKLVTNQFDKRYRTFFNNFFDPTTDSLPSNINIISWNYDVQIEGSYCRAQNCSLDLAQKKLNINPSPSYRESNSKSEIIKLNGTAGLFLNDTGIYENQINNFNEGLNKFISNHIKLLNNPSYTHALSFAFEHKNEFDNRKKKAKEIITNSEILVIIGYSFPRMNNEIDKYILSELSNLSHIYLQVPQSDFRKIQRNISRFDSDLAEGVELIDDLGEFFIP